MPSQTRFGGLAAVFDRGKSPLLNQLARLSVLYEDLRLELELILGEDNATQTNGEQGSDYKSIYFIRRSLVTMQEFHGCLLEILKTSLYRKAEPAISKLGREKVAQANLYFQNNIHRIKDLRNHFGGHFKLGPVESAVRNFAFRDVVGRIVLAQPSDTRPALALLYADQLVKGAIAYKLPNGDSLEEELKTAFEIIRASQSHALAATYALVHAFLWDRFEAEKPT